MPYPVSSGLPCSASLRYIIVRGVDVGGSVGSSGCMSSYLGLLDGTTGSRPGETQRRTSGGATGDGANRVSTGQPAIDHLPSGRLRLRELLGRRRYT